jgi:hypothetical protein
MPGDVFQKHSLRPVRAYDLGERKPQSALFAFETTLLSSVRKVGTRVTCNDGLDTTTLAHVVARFRMAERVDVRPYRCFGNEFRFHKRRQESGGRDFPFHVHDRLKQTGPRKLDPEFERSASCEARYGT